MADVASIPDGYPRLTAYICCDGAADAIAFYCALFGATERMRIAEPSGKVGHAELQLGDSVLMLSDEYAEMQVLSPRNSGATGTSYSLSLYVDDVDAVFATAIERGCTPLREPTDQFYGDRSGQFLDPWGHRWAVATHIEDISPDEMAARAAAMEH
jgi:PhnB protein